MRWSVYIKRSLDGQVFDHHHELDTAAEVQAMRMSQHLLPGALIEFDAIEMTHLPRRENQ